MQEYVEETKVQISQSTVRRKTYLFIKRAVDIIASLLALTIFSPVYLIIAIAVYINDPGPVIYSHQRIGLHNKPFRMWKFRSMCMDADKIIDQLTPQQIHQYRTEFKIDNDPRITKVGKFIRKTSLDELPQFANVLVGDMSLVGPRPLIRSEIETYYKDTKNILLSAKPGITGYWQAYARNNVCYESGERQKMEMHYVYNASLWLDIKILLQTVISVIKKQGAK